jgi:hypothetical protein
MLLTELLSGLRRRAGAEVAAFDGQPPVKVLLTVPALYGPAFQKLVEDAAQEAGFAEIELVPEPVAAARAWLAETGENGRELVVLDCGGGTLGWAYIRYDNGNFHLVPDCPAGCDPHVGGYDVDLELLNELRDLTEDPAEIEQRQPYYLNEIRHLKERYCRSLNLQPITVGGHQVALEGQTIQAVLDGRFVHQVVENLRSYLAKVEQACPDAQPTILLVGGSARITGLKDAIEKQTGRKALWWERSEFATVLGAAAPATSMLPLDNRAISIKITESKTPFAGMRWLELAPEWREYLASKCSQTKVMVWNFGYYGRNTTILDINGAELVQSGLIDQVEYENGEPFAVSDLYALLAARRYDVLQQVVAHDPCINWPYFLKNYLEYRNLPHAVLIIMRDQKKYSWDEVLVAALFLRSFDTESEWVREALEKVEKHASMRLLWFCVRVWRTPFGDLEAAKRCLHRYIEKNGSNPVEYAVAWKTLGQDQVARSCIEQAEAEAAEGNWIDMAYAWKTLFNDDDHAYRCLEKAEEEPVEADSFSSVYLKVDSLAHAWKTLFDDESRVRQCLQRCEKSATRSGNWITCAEFWKKYLNDNLQVRRCVQEAQTLAGYYGHWMDCAKGWMLLHDELKARRCLQQGEASILKGSKYTWEGKQWMEYARAWKVLVNDDARARQCLETAEAKARARTEDWLSLAASWKKVLNDDVRSLSCLQQSEREWLRKLEEVPPGVAKVLTRQGLGIDFWLDCAEAWITLFDDRAQALRCLERAETDMEQARDDPHYYLNYAEVWKRLNDNEKVRQCLTQGKVRGIIWSLLLCEDGPPDV